MTFEEIASVVVGHPSELIRFTYHNGNTPTFRITEFYDGYFYGFPINMTDLTVYDETPMFRVNPDWVASVEATGVLSTRVTTLEWEDDDAQSARKD